MGVFDHWHPVLLSRELGARPTPVRLHGRELVLFRSGSEVGALADRCPHRGMRLSEGRVEGGELVCPYHGWSFRADGVGRAPASPDLLASAPCFDAVERDGAVWVKARSSAAAFPRPDFDGFDQVAVLRHRVRAPLEVVLDNFIEVEHTATTHALLGYDRDRLKEVTIDVELTDDSVRVVNRGPQRKLPRALSTAFGVHAGDTFVDDWTTWFSPVHSVYDHYWTDPATGEARGEHLRTAVFFTPVTDEETDVFSFLHATTPPWARFGLQLLARLFVRGLGELEVRLDRRMLERMADQSPDLRGNRLGRFDQPLVEARKRVDALYRGGAKRPS